MSAYLSPVGNEPQVDSNGNPLVGGKIFSYLAGSSTPAATFTDSTGVTPQTNPIILNARGCPASPIWLQSGQAYKLVITDANGVTLPPTLDNVTGINDPALAAITDQWVLFTGTPTYISATSFSVAGDQTTTLQIGRRLKTTNTAGTIYSTITNSVFGAVTTVTVANDSGTLDSGLSAVSYGLLSAISSAVPGFTAFSAYNSVSQSVTTGVETKVTLGTEVFDTNSCFASSRFTPNVPGYYQLNGVLSGLATSGTLYMAVLYKNGSTFARGGLLQTAANNNEQRVTVNETMYLNGTTDYVELWGSVSGTSPTFNFGSTVSNCRFSGSFSRPA